MKFTKNVPAEDGWYWVVDTENRTCPAKVYRSDWSRARLVSCFGSLYSVDRSPAQGWGDRIETPEVEVCDD